jgi:hypothetical protein
MTMKNHFLLILILFASLHSCSTPDTTDYSLTPEEYLALGMPDYKKVWSLEDYSNAFRVVNTLKYKQPKALPSRDSEKSAVVFSRMINIDNLSFLQDETLALHDKAEMIQWYGPNLVELTASFTFLGMEEQYYIRELTDIDIFSVTIAQIMLDLGNKINESEDPEDIALQSDYPLIQEMYLDLISSLFEKQQKPALYPRETLELMSDSLSTSVRRNMHWFDEDASGRIKQALLTVIDSNSSRTLINEYQDLAGNL